MGNTSTHALTELDAATGALVQVVRGSSIGETTANGVSSDGIPVWVTNVNGNSVTELTASTGALVGVLRGRAYRCSGPFSIDSGGTNVWVGNGNESVTAFPAA